MLKYRTLQRILAALLLACLLPSAGLTALAEEYYFGEQTMELWDGAYSLTVDKRWYLEQDNEIPQKHGPHDKFWTWKQWCIKDNHNLKVIRFFKERYPFTYKNEASNELLMKEFARLYGHLRPVQYAVKKTVEVDQIRPDGSYVLDANGNRVKKKVQVYDYKEYDDYTTHSLKIGNWHAIQLQGFQYNAIVVATGEDLLYFASQHLDPEEFAAIIKTLTLGSNSVG